MQRKVIPFPKIEQDFSDEQLRLLATKLKEQRQWMQQLKSNSKKPKGN